MTDIWDLIRYSNFISIIIGKEPYIMYVGGGAEGFCEGHEMI